jgi:hypothetical protein
MYVFREGRRQVSSESLRRSFSSSLRELRPAQNSSRQKFLIVDSLLHAGELECGLADRSHAQQQTACDTTDALAAQLVSPKAEPVKCLLERLEELSLPDELTISVPEGFAYYALHPRQYARLAERIAFPPQAVAVVGIRSIGTTLSAVVKAALKNCGLTAERTTVRPGGHPFDRFVRFSSKQHNWILGQQRRGAQFLVVDEGPGLSGSSFLSTAEALVEAGVSPQQITLLCAHQPDPTKLCTRDAAARVARFTWCAVTNSQDIPTEAGVFVGSGRWRKHFGYGDSGWPASWTTMERAKFLSDDASHLHKFEGLGHYGEQVHQRARVLSEAGLSPPPASDLDDTGYVAYPWLASKPVTQSDLSEPLIKAIAGYCAFRSRALVPGGVTHSEQNPENLALMVHTNLTEEFGSTHGYSSRPLELVKPVIADARMQPWEWGRVDGNFVKFDAATHGDDHFFPGPTDIAWDLAGAIVEFSLGGKTEAHITPPLVQHYTKLTGDDPSFRLPAYMVAYSAFRLGYSKMAAQAMRGSDEEPGLERQYLQYREFLMRLLERRAAA